MASREQSSGSNEEAKSVIRDRIAPLPWQWIVIMAGLLVLGGCEEPDPNGPGDSCEIEDLQFELNEAIPTIADVTFSTSCEGVEEAGIAIGEDFFAPAQEQADQSWHAQLFGLAPTTEYTFVAEALVDGDTIVSAEQALITGGAPGSLPQFDVGVSYPSAHSDGFLITTVVAVPSAAAIIDRDGNYVWWTVEDDEMLTIRRARLSRDGEWIIYMVQSLEDGFQADKEGTIRWVRLDGSETKEVTIAGLHHDFVELPDGTIGVLHDVRDMIGSVSKGGDRIVEIQEDGSLIEVWSLWDQIEYTEEFLPLLTDGTSHANALDYDDETGHYTMSARNFHTLYEIDRDTGETVWRFGGEFSDFELDPGTFMGLQHQFDRLPDGLLVFDNGEDVTGNSRIVQYTLNEGDGTAAQIWEHNSDPAVYCYVLGDVMRLEGGNTLATWSTAGMFEELGPDETLVWSANLELGAGLGYTTPLETFYPSE